MIASIVRLLGGIAAAFSLFLSAGAPTVARVETPPPIFVAGHAIAQPAILVRGHVLVPVRGIFEALHASVSYTPPRIVVVRKNGAVLAGLIVSGYHAVVNNRPRILAVAPIRRAGRIYVPLRFIAEIAGATVTYSRVPRLVDIRIPNEAYAPLTARVAPVVVPPDETAPIWAFVVAGCFVIAFGVECARRLSRIRVAKRARTLR